MKTGTAELGSVVRALTGKDLSKTFRSDFETRLVFQKAMYLLCAGGAVKPSYRFGLYVYGPYSSDWATKGFEVSDGKSCTVELTDRAPKVEHFVSGKQTDELVALATLHFYHEHLGLSKDPARAKAEADGKLTVLEHFDTAWSQLESAGWLS
jgi:hypothetical protein